MHGAIPILRIGPVLLATVHIELRDDLAEAFQDDVLTAMAQSKKTVGIVIDISGLDTVDSYVARILADIARTAKLMGKAAVIVGMRPEVAATLVRMGYGMEGMQTALNLDEGLLCLGYRLERG